MPMRCEGCGEPLVSILERLRKICASCYLGHGPRARRAPRDGLAACEPPLSMEIGAPERREEGASDPHASLDWLIERAGQAIAESQSLRAQSRRSIARLRSTYEAILARESRVARP